MLQHYTCVRQTDPSDCGVASLATVALHHRMPADLRQLRELAGTGRTGTTLLGLARAAEQLGFAVKSVQGAYDALAELPLPAIAHLRAEESAGHFVVLHRVKKHRVILADPTRGVEEVPREAFCRRWTGYLLLLAPEQAMPAAGLGGRAACPWRRLLGLTAPHVPVLAEAFFCAVLMTLLGLTTSYFLQHLVDSVLVRGEARLLNALGLGLFLILIFRVLFGMMREYLMAHVGRQVDLTLVSRYARHLLCLPLRYFAAQRIGDALARVGDTGRVRDAISNTALTIVVDGTLVVLLLAVLWLYDVPLALVVTACLPLLAGTVALHGPAAQSYSRVALESAAELYSHLAEDVAGVETVKAFGAERARAEERESRLVRSAQSVFSLQKLGMRANALGVFVTGVSGLVVLWFGGHRVMSGALTIGQLMFFYSLLGTMLEPLSRLANVHLKVQDALVAVDRLFQILDQEAEQTGGDKKAVLTSMREGIELQDIGFHYDNRARVLERLNLRIPAGKIVAVVGESGSGKSTLLRLLMGFYHPTQGRILVDGVDFRDLDLESLRSRIGFVSQDPFIFNGTIYENIAVGQPAATLAQVTEAARTAGLEEFIAGLPERFETVIGERGANLSGGQRQRLAIARALLRQPEILIFDEATSHLDTATERIIHENLRTILAGKTVLLVTHRLSTIKDADLIYVLDQGRVTEQGTHRQLLALGGRYAALCRGQAEGESGFRPSPGARASSNGKVAVPAVN